MSPVSFNEPPALARSRERKTSFLTKLMLATGLVKTESGAQVLLFILAVLIFGATWYLVTSGPAPVEPINPSDYANWPR